MGRIEGRADLLLEIELLERGLRQEIPAEAAIIANVDAARRALQAEDDGTATMRIGDIKTAIAALAAPPSRHLSILVENTHGAAQALHLVPVRRHRDRAADLLARLTGFSPPAARAELSRRVFRPLLYKTLALVLAFLGLRTLYLSNDAFGAGGFSDYVALVIWAISADVASKTLSSIRIA